jgi:tetratricopeptide (TPR) repeat protein
LAEPWGLLVRQGGQALLEGRFTACEQFAARAGDLAPDEPAPALLAVAARREQGRVAEAELLARALVSAHPAVAEAQALLGAVLADLGRDAEAARQLARLDGLDPAGGDAAGAAGRGAIVAGALAAEIAAVLNLPGPAEMLHARLGPCAGAFTPTTGAVARHAGLLCHVLGRWDDAEVHFVVALRANEAAGAPVLVAHTRRQYAALLRARGAAGDWERAIELLTEAAAVYRRLDIDRLTEESEAVLRRSQDLGGDPPGAVVNLFRPAGPGWELSFGGRTAVVADSPGLRHLAALLAADGRPVHVVDLALGAAAAAGPEAGDSLRDQMVAEYRARLADLDAAAAEPAGAAAAAAADDPGPDPVAAALARAERDFLRAEMASVTAGVPAAGDVGDRARRLVTLRIRIALDRVDGALPGLAGHLRRGIRTGTFCLYEPERPERWKMGP